jgi:hypothetical protein
MPGVSAPRAWALPLVVLTAALVCRSASAADVLAKMTPGSSDGWSLSYLNGMETKLKLTADGSGISASDAADTSSRFVFVQTWHCRLINCV